MEAMKVVLILCVFGILKQDIASAFLTESERPACVTPLATHHPNVGATFILGEMEYVYPVILDHPALVHQVRIDKSHCTIFDRLLQVFHYSISYIEASDVFQQPIVYSKNFAFNWNTRDVMTINFDHLLYTKKITLGYTSLLPCEKVEIVGCETQELCSDGYCQNGGTCIEFNTCACANGYFGDICELPIAQIEVKDFDFKSISHSVMYTPDASFDVIGDVTLHPGDLTPQRIGRRGQINGNGHNINDHHHEAGALFHGLSASLHHHHKDKRYFGNYDRYSDVFNHNSYSGYCHSVSAQFGSEHDNYHNCYLYTTHGDQYNNYGCSLGYQNGNLNMHVQTEHYHHHCTAPFHHTTGQTHHITSSYSPQYGCQIYVDGKLSGSSSKPEPVTPPTTTSEPLCMGSCGAPSSGMTNCILSNITVPLLSLPCLAANGLLNLFGDITGALLHELMPTKTSTTLPTTTTPKPHIIVTATSKRTMQATPPSTGGSILCYSCAQRTANDPCSNLVTCPAGKVCSVFNDTHGFTQKCLEKKTCELGASLSSSTCWHCCDSNLCNDKCPASCSDTPQCTAIMSTGYDVCSDSNLAKNQCMKTCNHCP